VIDLLLLDRGIRRAWHELLTVVIARHEAGFCFPGPIRAAGSGDFLTWL
jgi:hypothetical protein